MRTFRNYLIEKLKDETEAGEYLKVALEEYEKDKNTAAFLLALKTVVDAQGGVSMLAKKTELNRQHLYRILSREGNPRFNTLDSILHGLGFKLSIESIRKTA